MSAQPVPAAPTTSQLISAPLATITDVSPGKAAREAARIANEQLAQAQSIAPPRPLMGASNYFAPPLTANGHAPAQPMYSFGLPPPPSATNGLPPSGLDHGAASLPRPARSSREQFATNGRVPSHAHHSHLLNGPPSIGLPTLSGDANGIETRDVHTRRRKDRNAENRDRSIDHKHSARSEPAAPASLASPTAAAAPPLSPHAPSAQPSSAIVISPAKPANPLSPTLSPALHAHNAPPPRVVKKEGVTSSIFNNIARILLVVAVVIFVFSFLMCFKGGLPLPHHMSPMIPPVAAFIAPIVGIYSFAFLCRKEDEEAIPTTPLMHKNCFAE